MRIGAIARYMGGAIILLSTGYAVAGDWDWAPDKEHGFYERFSGQRRPEPRRDFDVKVGGVVPDGVEMYDAPADYDYAPAKNYRYVIREKRVFVIEPKSRRIVHVIER